MKLLPLVLLAFILAACATPQEQIASGYAKLAATEQAQVQAEQAEREQARQATESAMMTAEAAQSEIDRMNAEAQATQTALENQKQAIAIQAAAYEQTQAAWEASVKVTGTMADIQATQTVRPTEIAAAMIAAQAKAQQQVVIANLLPFLALIIMLGLIAAIWIGLRFLYLAVEWQDRKNGQVQTRLGLVQYKQSGQLVDRAPLNIPNLNSVPLPEAPYLPDDDEPEQPEIVSQRDIAIDLLNRSLEIYGGETDRVATMRASGMNAERWQEIVNYLKSIGLVFTSSQGTHTTAPVRDVIYKLESTRPTPPAGVRSNGNGYTRNA